MGSLAAQKPHAICIPYPAQGHISPMLKLAKYLHFRGFHITFVNTEFNHQRLVKSRGSDSVNILDDFRFETIPDGLPPSDPDVTQDIPSLCNSVRKNCLVPFRDLINRLNDSSDVPNVTCIVSDGVMSFTLQAAEELDIPEVVFFTTSACGFIGYVYYAELVKRGYVPLKDESYLTNGYLDTPIDWIPGMEGIIRLKDFPTFIQTTDPDAIMLNYNIEQTRNALRAKGLILNTFDDLEPKVLKTIRSKFPEVFTIGPLQLMGRQIPESKLKSVGSSLWKEETGCLDWLNQWEPNSVVYVNFGSITVMTAQQLSEFAYGLANSKHPFLWIIRPDMVSGENAKLPEEFVEETKGRGMLASWCPQEQVLSHPSIGGFLTHSGWNSTIESISEGVPMICWPFFAEQQTNCRYVCTEWAIGSEIDSNVKRDEVEKLVRELMEEEKGRDMRKKALDWKEKAQLAIKPGGSSYMNLERLINQVLLGKSSSVET
ncbi:UDP-glucuronosyl/UDP-glucosyltransferase [Macleaya cordata]|uniref:Glycosyltransferase n=1 Tax=Macleaya cordata TaxID=56857 RepID=A0A200R7V8_MACCD|nr:UDP-glucuronosyl/UDP-glucosyltransferase [Macleaya cordata]